MMMTEQKRTIWFLKNGFSAMDLRPEIQREKKNSEKKKTHKSDRWLLFFVFIDFLLFMVDFNGNRQQNIKTWPCFLRSWSLVTAEAPAGTFQMRAFYALEWNFTQMHVN